MISRRELFYLSLLPLGLIGGVAVRTYDLFTGGIMYFWTDGTEVWFNGWDAPAHAKGFMRWGEKVLPL